MTASTAPSSNPGPSRPSALRAAAFAVAGVLLALVVCLVLVEVALRVYSRVTPNVDVEFYRYARTMKAAADGSGVVFRHTPGARGTFFGVDVHINSRGFRDAEWGSGQATGRRIALLGDSVTFGWGVPYGQRFSELLEERWSAVARQRVELLNTGHGNYNTAQEYATLVDLAADDGIDADDAIDAVVQVWYINDAEPTPAHRPAPWYARFHTAIFIWAKTDLIQRRLGARQDYVDYYRNLYRADAPGWAAFADALEKTGRWATERGVPWFFVVLPEFHSFEADGPFAGVYERVGHAAAAAGARVVDATPAFEGTDPASVWVAYNDVHPNATGHRIIADAIHEALVGEFSE